MLELIRDPSPPLLRGDQIAALTGASGPAIGAAGGGACRGAGGRGGDRPGGGRGVHPRQAEALRRGRAMSASRFDRTADRYAAAARAARLVGHGRLVRAPVRRPGARRGGRHRGAGRGAAGDGWPRSRWPMSPSRCSRTSPPGRSAVVARAEQLPFEDESFDLVACVRALHHIDSPTRALDEMARRGGARRPGRDRGLPGRPRPGDRLAAGRSRAAARPRSPAAAGRPARCARGCSRRGSRWTPRSPGWRRSTAASWLELAGCDQPLAAGIRGGGRRARVSDHGRPGTLSPARRVIAGQAAAGVRRSMSRSISASLHSRRSGERGPASRQLPGRLGQANAVHEGLDVSFVEHSEVRSRRSTATPASPSWGIPRRPRDSASLSVASGYSAPAMLKVLVAALIGTAAGVGGDGDRDRRLRNHDQQRKLGRTGHAPDHHGEPVLGQLEHAAAQLQRWRARPAAAALGMPPPARRSSPAAPAAAAATPSRPPARPAPSAPTSTTSRPTRRPPARPLDPFISRLDHRPQQVHRQGLLAGHHARDLREQPEQGRHRRPGRVHLAEPDLVVRRWRGPRGRRWRRAPMRWWQRSRRTGWRSCSGFRASMRSGLWDALADSSIRCVVVRHEQAAAFAAQGYARTSDRVGVCITSTGPGAFNAFAGMGEADASSLRVLHVTTQIPSDPGRAGLDARDDGAVGGVRCGHPAPCPAAQPGSAGGGRRRGADGDRDAPGPAMVEAYTDVLAAPAEGAELRVTPVSLPAPDPAAVARVAELLSGRASADDLRRRRQPGRCVAGGRAGRGAGRAGCHELQRQGRDARRPSAACGLVAARSRRCRR